MRFFLPLALLLLAIVPLPSAAQFTLPYPNAILHQDLGDRLPSIAGLNAVGPLPPRLNDGLIAWGEPDGTIVAYDVVDAITHEIPDSLGFSPVTSAHCVAWSGAESVGGTSVEIFVGCLTPGGVFVQQLTNDEFPDGLVVPFLPPLLSFDWPVVAWVKCLELVSFPFLGCGDSRFLVHDLTSGITLEPECGGPVLDLPYLVGRSSSAGIPLSVYNLDTQDCVMLDQDLSSALAIEAPWIVLSRVGPDLCPSNRARMFLHLYNMDTQETVQIGEDPTGFARIHQGRVVWDTLSCDFDSGTREIWMYDTESMAATRLTHNDVEDGFPEIDGGHIVWQRFDGADHEIIHYEIASGRETQLTRNGVSDIRPSVEDSIVVWVPEPRGTLVVSASVGLASWLATFRRRGRPPGRTSHRPGRRSRPRWLR